MTPRLQVKAFPPGASKPFQKKPAAAPGKAPAAPPAAAAPPQPVDPAQDPAQDPTAQPHEWAGDLDESGQESDPGQAFASFTGQGGEAAWLDRADDGTITGWVKDADGSVYRYSDADSWAIDVDDATMTRSDPGSMGADPAADPNAAPEDQQGGGAGTDEQDPAQEPDPNAEPAAEDPAMEDPATEDPSAAADLDPAADPNVDPSANPDEDDEDDDTDLFKKVKPQKKSARDPGARDAYRLIVKAR